MNERIRTFMEDCFDISIDGRGREECTADYAGIERFSDLIVRECAKIAVAIECPIEEGISRQTQGHTWDMACVAAATKIKEHFGVAE
jgi:hypothetical protein